MRKILGTLFVGFAPVAFLSAQDPLPIAMPGPIVPAYSPLPALGYPIAPVGGGMYAPVPGMYGQPIQYGYPPIGFPAHPIMPPNIYPVAFQTPGTTLVPVPMPMPMPMPTGRIEPIRQKTGSTTKINDREAPPSHFGPHYSEEASRRILELTADPLPQ